MSAATEHRLPGQDPALLFDAAVEVLVVNEEGTGLEEYPGEFGFNEAEPALVVFGAVVPTECDHTHVEGNPDPQPWN